jgi:hypothetical protein
MKLSTEDVVVIEATGNAAAVAAVLAPHVKKVVIANPKQVRVIGHAKIKTDTIDAGVFAQPLRQRPSAGGLGSRRADAGASPTSDPAQPDRSATVAIEEHHPIDPAQPSDPLLSAR